MGVTEAQAAWIAGIIEGEECFIKRTVKGRIYGGITVGMTDEDVVVRLYGITGMGNINYKMPSANNLGKKMATLWEVHKNQEVRDVCALIAPWLGKRRTKQMNSMLADMQQPGYNKRIRV